MKFCGILASSLLVLGSVSGSKFDGEAELLMRGGCKIAGRKTEDDMLGTHNNSANLLTVSDSPGTAVHQSLRVV